jgi:hypothetical protein
MSLIKKKDVEAHFAARRRVRLAALGFVRKPVSSGIPVPERATKRAKTSGFREDFSIEHSSPGFPVAPSK